MRRVRLASRAWSEGRGIFSMGPHDNPNGAASFSPKAGKTSSSPAPIMTFKTTIRIKNYQQRRDRRTGSIFHGRYCSGTFENIFHGMPSDNTSGSDRRSSCIRDISARTLTLNDQFWRWQKWDQLRRRSRHRLLMQGFSRCTPFGLSNVETNGHREVERLARHVRRWRWKGLRPPHRVDRFLIKGCKARRLNHTACQDLPISVERERQLCRARLVAAPRRSRITFVALNL